MELGEKETILVGANNSGKTSAMEALILFLKQGYSKKINTSDFTLTNWPEINEIGENWVINEEVDLKQDSELVQLGECKFPNLYLEYWRGYLPALDIWFDARDSEIQYISHLIPTLAWSSSESLGVRLILEPAINNHQQIESLYKDFRSAYSAVEETLNAARAKNKGEGKETKPPKLWPQSLREFLDEELHKYFSLSIYLLDPKQIQDPDNGQARPQKLRENAIPVRDDALKGLLKVDVIHAQRGFSDVHSTGGDKSISLSSQFRNYYEAHLNPNELPSEDDIEALSVINEAKDAFNHTLKSSFGPAIAELENLGYPGSGFGNPSISINCDVDPIEGISHKSAVQFSLGADESGSMSLDLPEKYNGLGYQNLIWMVFELIRFRDQWMRRGKAKKRLENDEVVVEPLHLVLIEEPEAYLHVQVQQVFINNSYEVLRKNPKLGELDKYITQMVVSTHSSHISHEVEFSKLRYFKRNFTKSESKVPYAELVNLSSTFGDEDKTPKFVTRYLKASHCDLFFADAVILVEGPAERMLIPYFIKKNFPELRKRYITILEIGGSHAHTLRPLIETLGIYCLVITDLDSKTDPEKGKGIKIQPEFGKKYKTGNDTLSKWCPATYALDHLLCSVINKESANGLVRVAYQFHISTVFNAESSEIVSAIPYTFEDALVLSNINLIRNLENTKGLLAKMQNALDKEDIHSAAKSMFDDLGESAKKAEMAVELFYLEDPEELMPPNYISEALEWLQDKLGDKRGQIAMTVVDDGGGVDVK